MRPETWMDSFAKLQPEGGVRAVVQQVWNQNASLPRGAGRSSSLNGALQVKPVYGLNRLSPRNWMDRFAKLEPEGGVRAVVRHAWNGSAPKSHERLATLASLFAETGTDRAIDAAHVGLPNLAAE